MVKCVFVCFVCSTSSLPPLDWPLPAHFGQCELKIEVQPKTHHRAHYETEGSRGAVKASTGGHPVVKVWDFRGVFHRYHICVVGRVHSVRYCWAWREKIFKPEKLPLRFCVLVDTVALLHCGVFFLFLARLKDILTELTLTASKTLEKDHNGQIIVFVTKRKDCL